MAGLSPFNRNRFSARAPALFDDTISDFSGGLNVVDNDVTMRTKYAKVLENWQQGTDGSLAVRFGCQFRYDVANVVSGTITEIIYFQQHLVVFMSSGEIAKINEAGVVAAIWNNAIAANLPGSPTAWTVNTTSVDLHTFKSDLIAHNGKDKPLIVDKNLVVKYLQDPSSGSNIYTPVGKYGTTVANYACIAGIATSPGEVYISSTGTSGVYPGDAAPNDSISVNVAAYAPTTNGEIIGLASFRNSLIVLFEGALLVVELGIFDDAGNHTPKPQDAIVERGVISFRTMVATKNDVMMADTLGYHTLTRNTYGLVDTRNFSELVEPEYQGDTPTIVGERIKCFSVYNPLELRMMTFMPDGKCWVNSHKENSKEHRWAVFSGWQWSCGCHTEKGRVFFAKGSRIYQYGNKVYQGEDFSADYVDDFDVVWASSTTYVEGVRALFDGVVYICKVDHVSDVFLDDYDERLWEVYRGEPIKFVWELPWTSIANRARKKQLRYIQADTGGAAAFSVDVFVDNFYKDQDGAFTPALSLAFVAGSANGYGKFDQHYGGGRRLRDERPWGMPTDFKIMKLRIYGETVEPLSISSITFFYFNGTARR